MWTLSTEIFIPIEDRYDYRLKVTVARDAISIPAEYDTDAILLWQKDDKHPKSAPVTVDYFTTVCSVADLTLRPDVGSAIPTDLLYRKNELDMVFRSEALMMDCLNLIVTDIRALKIAINSVIDVTDDPDYATA